ncbi:MAG: transglutaminase domain-containing protein [Bacteroidota bacterium]
MKKISPFLLLFVLSCSSPKIHIPGNYENKFVYAGQDEAAATEYSIKEAGKLAELYPDEEIVNDEIKITMRFEQNDRYDTLAFKKLGDQVKKKKKETDKNLESSKVNLARDLEKLLNGELKNLNLSAFSTTNSSEEELTENPLPDGEVFTNTKFEYEYTTIKDFVNEPFVVEYNSMTKPKNFSFKIDDKVADLEKEKEKNEGGGYFKTDSRYLIYNLNLPIRGTRVNARYFESCRDAKFNNLIYIPESHYTVKKVIKISKPEWLDFEIIEKNFEGLEFKKEEVEESTSSSDDDDDDSGSKSNKKKQKFIVYTFKNLPAYQRYRDGRGASYNLPMLYIHYKSVNTPKVKKNIFNSTDDLYKWYRQVTGTLQNDTAKFAEFTRNLVKDAKTDEEKIKKVFYWIQDNVRYIAFEDGIAGFRPDECSNVFSKKYGDCKGMANLSRNMLKVLGYDARMVWIGTRHLNFSYDIPGLNVDNHAICAVKLNEKLIFLDATETYCALGDYANRIQGRRCIVEDGEKYTIERIPEFGPEHNRTTVTENVTLNNGQLDVKGKKIFLGESKIDFLRDYNLLRIQNRDEALYNYLTNEKIFIEATNISSSDLNNRDIDAEVKYDLNVSNHMFSNNGKTFINLAWDRELAGFDFDTIRKVDFDFGLKMDLQSNIVLTLNSGQKVVQLPKAVNIDNAYYAFNLEIVQQGNTLVYKKSMVTKQDYIPVNMLKQFTADSKQLTNFYNTFIVLEN